MGLLDYLQQQDYGRGLLSPSGNPVGRWAQGVAKRTMHPLEAAAQASQELMSQPVDELAMNWINPVGVVGSVAGKDALKAIAGRKTEFELAHEVAQRNAALLVEQGGLGLLQNNTAMDRARAMAGLKMPESIPENLTKKDLKSLVQSDVVQRAHTVGDLQFQTMPIADFNRASTSYPVYKSPSYNGNQSSEYRLGIVNGEPVYMRKSDHFGNFGVNIKEGTPEGNAMLQSGSEIGDNFGRMGKTVQNWQLNSPHQQNIAQALEDYHSLRNSGASQRDIEKAFDKYYKLTQKSEAGYIPLSELQGRLPEKIYAGNTAEVGNYFDAPMIKLPSGQLRSRFAAFDPMQRNSANIMAGGAAGAVGLGLLNDPQSGGLLYGN